MSASQLVAALGIYAGTFVVAAISSLFPLVVVEVFLVGVAVALAPAVAPLPALVLLAAAGQVAGKLPIYYGTRRLSEASGPHHARLERARAWVARRRSKTLVLATSAVFGLPPFTIIATAAGALAIPVRTFCAVIFAARALRFAVIVAAAALAA